MQKGLPMPCWGTRGDKGDRDTSERVLAGLDAGDQSPAGDGSMAQLELASSEMHLEEAMWLFGPETRAGSSPLYLSSLVTCLTCPVESPAPVQGLCHPSSTP